ncbi:MAG: patatin-like phospholipase family protein [Methylocella sp.]
MLWLTPNWAVEWIFPLADAAVLVAAALLYRSMLPEAWEFVTKRPDAASIENIGGGPTFLPLPFMSPRVCARIIPLLPSMMRLTTLDAIFHREPLGGLAKQLRLYLGAVELTRGQPMIFSNAVLAPLGIIGARDLWEQRWYHDTGPSWSSTFDITWLPIADAVAASSAFPPFFRPITIRRREGLVGIFSDGGVVDNAALLAPFDAMIFCSQNEPRYAPQQDGERSVPRSFEETINDLFIVNAGAPPSHSGGPWSTYRVLRRIVDIMQGSQEVHAIQKLSLKNPQAGPKSTTIALGEASFPLEDGSCHNVIADYAAHIRTHFDAFDAVETAILVYVGYYEADRAFGARAEARKPLRSFRDVAHEVTNDEIVGNMSRDEIVRHLHFSNRRWAGERQILRAIDRFRSALGKT